MRAPNTNARGGSWTSAQIEAVWRMGRIVPGYDPAAYRKDSCNAWISRTSHGLTMEYGWEIDHSLPVAGGGGDDLLNLQPLHWKNNRHKGDSWPQWSCAIAAAS